MRKPVPIHIVSSRVPGDEHDWVLVRGDKYKCVLCGCTLPVEPIDALMLRSGCSAKYQEEIKGEEE